MELKELLARVMWVAAKNEHRVLKIEAVLGPDCLDLDFNAGIYDVVLAALGVPEDEREWYDTQWDEEIERVRSVNDASLLIDWAAEVAAVPNSDSPLLAEWLALRVQRDQPAHPVSLATI